MKIRVSTSISPLTIDIEPEARYDALQIDAAVNRCVHAVTECLKYPSPRLTDVQRGHLVQIFLSMRHVHRSIRELLRSDGKDPMAVSVMSIVRAQLETLFATCLIIEKPDALDAYLKDGWKKIYVRHLMMLEECQGLERVRAGLEKSSVWLEGLRKVSGVTEAEKHTVDYEELGTPMPQGLSVQHIAQFPTPAKVIREIQDGDRKKMVIRLYFGQQITRHTWGACARIAPCQNDFAPAPYRSGFYASLPSLPSFLPAYMHSITFGRITDRMVSQLAQT